ncbi:MAG: hypothetical protein IPL61_33515 [Myxococcales bacterium]|nr:hypothetical protein [Myxococcales bacterium]
MAKKQTRRSISVSRSTYERLKSFCETSGISMSQFVESRVGDFLGEDAGGVVSASAAGLASNSTVGSDRLGRAQPSAAPAARPQPAPMRPAAAPMRPAPRPAPMTSAAARFAVDPPPPIIKKAEQAAPKAPSMPKADQIFTF